ncbi:nucleotide-diphospho-sugar transferase [Periconia macrospinosa]|uniref:Nucleotide-diphospho-sugar transferase n=1 Tax=Periconia macrospinosa TaxID=97972 RepID=A0A2V1D605_9PLEO|nr:nucleotide-diphospho-sugar transferase [Periconia macrospinosa]
MTVSTESSPGLSIALLAAGDSVRMGSPKHLLPDADGTPVYLSRLTVLRQTFPDARNLCLLLRDSSQCSSTPIPPELGARILCVDASTPESRPRGPAVTFLAAYSSNPTSHWLFVPCDYPLLTAPELTHLCNEYRDPVTCFENAQGITEPLVGIWSPLALSHIAANAMSTRQHLMELVDRLEGNKIPPLYDHSLFNANTREDWEDAVQLLAQSCNA